MSKPLTFGEMLRRVRVKRGMSYGQVAGAMQGVQGVRPIHRTEVMRIEKSNRLNPSATTLHALCVALDIRITFDPLGMTVEDMDDVREQEGWQ